MGLLRRIFFKAGVENIYFLEATDKFIQHQPKAGSMLGWDLEISMQRARDYKKNYAPIREYGKELTAMAREGKLGSIIG
ncbi:chaperone protein ClpB2, chloroplastic-like [Helianthus annuus]|uniref:chaperone protein ClpB2, chloroplastic-like n=1 Tax=Helianthus annuus TaxID=4232 RepID=UPI00165309F8|nr:chaperone protein ClpB2, chloroplastic-like [Helianthus annuus]XP_035831467.1 chaperone protein ClpB2, chloroplastic-like [Helianthus annuus]